VLQRRPNTFAQTILSLSFFACDKAADHTFLFADNPGVGPSMTTRAFVGTDLTGTDAADSRAAKPLF
jgi:hypothetical protein